MIIKSLSRKEPSFAQLTSYLLEARGAKISLYHNLRIGTETPKQVIADFEENYTFLPSRKNGNALFHEIISLEPNDAVSFVEQARALRLIAERYLELRAPLQQACGVIHTDTAHVHMHLMVSSNAIMGRHRISLSKGAFRDIQRDIEAYQRAHFPELGGTYHYDRASRGLKQTNREQEAQVRSGKPSHKQELSAKLKITMRKARNRAELETALSKLGLTLYQRGRSAGVKTTGGRRYRFSTLGLGYLYAEMMARFELAESRLKTLNRARSQREAEQERES